jgi:hypothetical protein
MTTPTTTHRANARQASLSHCLDLPAAGSHNGIHNDSQTSIQSGSSGANVTIAPQLQVWPTKEEELGKITLLTVLSNLADLILVLTPSIFIGKFYHVT